METEIISIDNVKLLPCSYMDRVPGVGSLFTSAQQARDLLEKDRSLPEEKRRFPARSRNVYHYVSTVKKNWQIVVIEMEPTEEEKALRKDKKSKC